MAKNDFEKEGVKVQDYTKNEFGKDLDAVVDDFRIYSHIMENEEILCLNN